MSVKDLASAQLRVELLREQLHVAQEEVAEIISDLVEESWDKQVGPPKCRDCGWVFGSARPSGVFVNYHSDSLCEMCYGKERVCD